MERGTARKQEVFASISLALDELDQTAPGVPLLALGQTVLWDEPMKAGVARLLTGRESNRRFVAGVHDTDFFAKLASGPRSPGTFVALPHNSTTTKNLWSAAAEFSALFGGETVIRRSDFLRAGARIEAVLAQRPNALDEATEAFGWRGVVSLDEEPPIVRDVPLPSLFPELRKTFVWAIDSSLESLGNGDRDRGAVQARKLLEIFDSEYADHLSLSEFYQRLLPKLYSFLIGTETPLETTTTSELLTFNTITAGRARFELVQLFLDPETRTKARQAYDEALAGSEIYGLDRFGTGALPFDLVIPGIGRGTLRVGNRGIIIETPKPQFISLKRPVWCVNELAEAIEKKFGPECVLVGKAVSLIGMLSREFVFVFHEGASSYVDRTIEFHKRLKESNLGLHWNPILRIRYHPWDSLSSPCTWLKLPEPFQLAFGAEDMCSPSFASRWRSVGREQRVILSQLGEMRRPAELIQFFDEIVGGAWSSVAKEYRSLHAGLESHIKEMEKHKEQRHRLYSHLRGLKAKRVAAERAKGDHFREKIFEKSPNEADLKRRNELEAKVAAIIDDIQKTKNHIRHIIHQQTELSQQPNVQEVHRRRRAIEVELELKRMRVIRHAIISSKGLEHAGQRPSAWWFPLVSPNGVWLEETWRSAHAYLEPLM